METYFGDTVELKGLDGEWMIVGRKPGDMPQTTQIAYQRADGTGKAAHYERLVERIVTPSPFRAGSAFEPLMMAVSTGTLTISSYDAASGRATGTLGNGDTMQLATTRDGMAPAK